MTLEEWPDCPIRGCKHKICLARGSKYCFQHTVNIEFLELATLEGKDDGA